MKLAEEVGEVMEITAAIGGSKRKIAKLGGTENIKNKLIEELGDVICVALTCAYQYDITPEELFAANAEKLLERMAAKKEEATAPVKTAREAIHQHLMEKSEKQFPSREFIYTAMMARSEQIKNGCTCDGMGSLYCGEHFK